MRHLWVSIFNTYANQDMGKEQMVSSSNRRDILHASRLTVTLKFERSLRNGLHRSDPRALHFNERSSNLD